MDKRLLILIAVFILGSASLFGYRKLMYKPEGIKYTIKPREAINTGDSISYSDNTPGASRWKWDFGDGEYSADQSGHHTYLSPGKYDVTLTAYGPFGVQKRTESVTVLGSSNNIISTPAGPSISGPADAKAGTPASWQASTKAERYEWKVEGDAALAANKQTGSSATYTFKSAGQRTLVLTTHNPDATVRRSITVMPADAKPEPATASMQMPPRQQPAQQSARPKPAQQQPQKPRGGNSLEDLGDGVEIKK